MGKTFNIIFITIAAVIIFCCMYDIFYYKRKIFNKLTNQSSVRTTLYNKGEVTYLIFTSPEGYVDVVNYTSDSMDLEMHKKFDQ